MSAPLGVGSVRDAGGTETLSGTTADLDRRAWTAIGGPTVELDGVRLVDDAAARLVSMRVASRLNQPTQIELTYRCAPGPVPLTSAGRLGAPLRVIVAGTDGNVEPLFVGEVTCVEYETEPDGSPLFRIRGYDALHRLRKRQQLRVFEQTTAAGIVQQLVDNDGLTVDAQETGPPLERVLQHRHSDFELLQEVCGRAGLYAYVDGDTLRLITLEGQREPLELTVGVNLWTVRISANLDRISTERTALGWHPQRAELLTGTASEARSALTARQTLDPYDVGGDGVRTLIDQAGRSDDEVTALAQAAQDVATASALTVSGTAEGNAELRVGRRIEVRGVADAVAGRYLLTEVIHTIDGAGYLTAFSTEPPPPALQTVGATVTLGRVTAVDDPDRLGRVQLELPTYGDLDAGWLAVVCPGAGKGRGIVALPDVDDTVLVILPHGEPTAGLVLGSLYGTIEPPDTSGIDGGHVGRWSMTTAGGQSIVIDDAGKALRLTNDAGSRVELTPDRLTVHAATDLVIEAPGKQMTIRAATIDFQQVP